MYKIYQAGPLFSDVERSWHGKLSERLRAAGHSVVWPGDLLTSDQIKAAVLGLTHDEREELFQALLA